MTALVDTVSLQDRNDLHWIHPVCVRTEEMVQTRYADSFGKTCAGAPHIVLHRQYRGVWWQIFNIKYLLDNEGLE